MDRNTNVGIADMAIARREGILITYALGSCIGISIYDPVIKLGGLLHIMLPERGNMMDANPLKFADSGIAEMLRKMSIFGGMKNRYICKIAGGAKMFDIKGGGSLANIGERNAESVRRILMNGQIRITGQDVGENYARTMLLNVENGDVKIRTFGRPDKSL